MITNCDGITKRERLQSDATQLLQLVSINVFSDNWKALLFIEDYCYPGVPSTVMFLCSLKQVIQKTSEFLFFASAVRVQCQYQDKNFLNKVSK